MQTLFTRIPNFLKIISSNLKKMNNIRIFLKTLQKNQLRKVVMNGSLMGENGE